ncbi:ADP-ribosylglycohydrolase [Actinomadura rubteroloni]|uniref:ADP-ribosylglycohydrolase n=1 Tax=Actinomadura rubteroloni TaxID=1926885 RepID=A0A2P4UPZ4_9ACTN|nr:ADP-ribosylglycohydrolase family protein [Actinomadura rubteroloni]POM27112.1 ADP-ribosylglycohydrolase [Actinomadura rubteroloni]
MPLTPAARSALARDALAGLAAGDAFGDQFFARANRGLSALRDLPPEPWEWSDDTEMACSVVAVLERHGGVDQDALAASFVRHRDVGRRYGMGALELLDRLERGAHWATAARELFDGGSYGNGAAMRVAPLGAYFADDPERAAEQAARSAEVTHAHPEGIAGAVATAVAASFAASRRGARVAAGDVLAAARDAVPPGSAVARGLDRALALLPAPAAEAARELGNGARISAQDTVPFALWAAAVHLADFEAAVRACAAAGGDMDTTAAIAGGVIAAHGGADAVPAGWRAAHEPLPAWLG